MDLERKQQIEQENAARLQTEGARRTMLLAADYSQETNLDSLYGDLSVAEIKLLYSASPSFKKAADSLTNAQVITNFRTLTPELQQAAYAAYSPEQKAIIDADYDAFAALPADPQIPVVPPIEEARTAEQTAADEAAAQAQAETDRIAAEAAEAARIAAQPTEMLYDGVEKLGESNYKLTVDPEDGTPPEIFYGTSQKECFKALRKSKANATKELRRRKKKVQITDDLKGLQVEIVNYPSPIEPLKLTPDEIFVLTEQLKDPVTVLEATRKLRQASLTQEECARQNEAVTRQRYSDQYNTAITWVNTHSDFYNCPDNIEAMQNLMAGLNWAVTIKNMDLAFKILKEQSVLLDPPEDDPSSRPIAQPASVVPVASVIAAPVAQVAQVPVSAPASVLPAADKVLRPGSSSTAAMPTRRIDLVSTAPPKVVLTVEEYNKIPAAEAKMKYQRDPEFKRQFDALVASGKI